jgi:hypothetical protein
LRRQVEDGIDDVVHGGGQVHLRVVLLLSFPLIQHLAVGLVLLEGARVEDAVSVGRHAHHVLLLLALLDELPVEALQVLHHDEALPRRFLPAQELLHLSGQVAAPQMRLSHHHNQPRCRVLSQDVNDACGGVAIPLADVAEAVARLAVDPENENRVLLRHLEQRAKVLPVVAPLGVVADAPEELLLLDLPRHEPIEDALLAPVDHLQTEGGTPAARGDLPQEPGFECLRGGKRVIVADVDDVGAGAGEDEVVEGADLVEAAVIGVEFADVTARGIRIDAEDLLLQALHRFPLEDELFSKTGRIPRTQRSLPSSPPRSFSPFASRNRRTATPRLFASAGSLTAPKRTRKMRKIRRISPNPIDPMRGLRPSV